jgi:hypothetical protein
VEHPKHEMNSGGGLEEGTPELIDMIGARFEVIAGMGTGDADIVLFRTRMSPGRVVPLHSHMDPE